VSLCPRDDGGNEVEEEESESKVERGNGGVVVPIATVLRVHANTDEGGGVVDLGERKTQHQNSQSFLVAFNSKGTLNASSSFVTVLMSICRIAHGFVTTAFRSTVSTRGSFRAMSFMHE